MALVLPTTGQANWDVTLNNALLFLNSQLGQINGVSITNVPASGEVLQSTGTSTAAWANALSPSPNPMDSGYASWSYDPIAASNSTAPTGGTMYLSRFQVRSATTVSKVAIAVVSVSGMSLTSGQNFLAIFNSSGTQIAATADITASVVSGELVVSLVTPVNLSTGFYWGAILMNGTTLPTLARAQGQVNNLGSSQTPNSRRFGSSGTLQTALPASFTPSGITAVTSQTYWFAVA